MVAGGAEAAICRIGLAGFAACKALSTAYNDAPEKASRPYDRDRDGFVMGEGAATVVLEDLDHALARGANIIAEVVGYGLSGDAYHITAPAEDGDGAYRCMQMALKRAGLTPADIDYINAHGTSTMADTIELGAVERLVGDAASNISMSSTKSSIGHLLGAAGAMEAVFAALAIRDNVAPPTLNLDNPEVESRIDLVPKVARKRKIDVALSNSFGFGGTNASLVSEAVSGLDDGAWGSRPRILSPDRHFATLSGKDTARGFQPCFIPAEIGLVNDRDNQNKGIFGRAGDKKNAASGPIVPVSPSQALKPEMAPQPPKRSRRARNQVVVFLNFVLSMIIFIAIVGVGVFWYGKTEFEGPGPLDQTTNFMVREGAGLNQIAAGLERQGIIANQRIFFRSGPRANSATARSRPASTKSRRTRRCARSWP